MASSVKIPSSYTNTINFGTGLTISTTPITVNSVVAGDPNNPVTTLIIGDKNQPVSTHVTGDGDHPVASLITGDPNKPISTHIDLRNLPHLNKQDIKDLLTPELRVHIPHYNQLCFKVMGLEVFTLCFSGESQVVTEPYAPNAYERCEPICCEPDTRPFPKGQSTPTPVG